MRIRLTLFLTVFTPPASGRNHLRLRARLVERLSRLQQFRLLETVFRQNRYFLSLKEFQLSFSFSCAPVKPARCSE
jgi:hypothetical protein